MQSLAGPGLDTARDLLRLACPRPARCDCRRARVHLPRPRGDSGAGGDLPGELTALWIAGAAAGAGAGVAAVALHAGLGLVPASRRRARSRLRWVGYAILGTVAGALLGPWLVLVLIACGLVEIVASARGRSLGLFLLPAIAVPAGGLGALAWVAIKVGALSYGGGFVIIPLMQSDAVHHYHWVTNGQFLNAVALGQITPGRSC